MTRTKRIGRYLALLGLLVSVPSACTSWAASSAKSPAVDPHCHSVERKASRLNQVEVYRWTSDGFGGYRPTNTGLTGSHIRRARIGAVDSSGVDLDLVFDQPGTALLSSLTTAAASARTSRGSVAEAALTWFVGLTDYQISRFDNTAIVDRAMSPLDQGGNLLANPAIVNPIQDGRVSIHTPTSLEFMCSLTRP